MDLLFSFKGRIGRAQYWLGGLGVAVIFSVAMGILVAMFPPVQTAPGQPPDLPPALLVAMAIAYIPMLWVSFALTIKRGHDRGRSGWWQLLALVPLANIWLFIDQGFMRGIDAVNAWGPPAVPRDQIA